VKGNHVADNRAPWVEAPPSADLRIDGHAPPSDWYRLDPLELATGFVFGYADPATATEVVRRDPVDVLEDLLTHALQRTPCLIAFSGGRDSSALLALAVDVARRRGLDPPIPITRRFINDPASDETSWQTRVVQHLGIDEWTRVRLSNECDLLGPLATDLLRRHGLLWPPTAHVNIPLLEIARGGTLMTGEGGDEVFGIRRATPLRHLRGGARRRRAALGALPSSIGPASTRRRHLTRELHADCELEWLTRPARAALLDRKVSHCLQEPLSWRASTRRLAHRRSWIHGAATMGRVAKSYDVTLCHPLLEPRFLAALAVRGSYFGPMARSEVMGELFGLLLPDDILRRTSKAIFNTAMFGRASRSFVEQWIGSGVDTDRVDPVGLRTAWSQAIPHAGTFSLLQAAWLGSSHERDASSITSTHTDRTG
jgi:hypothetical protein